MVTLDLHIIFVLLVSFVPYLLLLDPNPLKHNQNLATWYCNKSKCSCWAL